MQSEYFILTKETKINIFVGIKLYRIKCIKNFKYAQKGDLGGWVSDNARVSGNAWVSGDARVYGDDIINYSVINIITDKWSITFGTHVTIGCKRFSIEEWRIFNDDEISGFHSQALEFWNKWKTIIFSTWEIHAKLNLGQ
jgi:hypothetical protein